mmetsp:Transcript_13195/g.24374  ORF Transcript_13195/g.24374 Transcript_13195/m.24374 type:complete len:900 (-) Transcript_13195:99-2798(-)
MRGHTGSMATNGDSERDRSSKHGDALPYHLEAMTAKNGHHAVSEERAALNGQALREPLSAAGRALLTELTTTEPTTLRSTTELAALRAEIVDLESEVKRYGTKEAEFKPLFDLHLEDVKRNDKTLHSNIDGLESEQSQLRVLFQQQESEQAWLQLREKEGQEQCSQTERRIQVLMDKLVVLLSASGFQGNEMHAEILEDLQGSIRKIEAKLQTVQSQLDAARQENREAAVRLSNEQRKTKRLHDELCGKQGDLFSRKLCTMPGAPSASSAMEPSRMKAGALRWTSKSASPPQPGPPEAGAGISQPFTERPAHSWVPCASPAIPEHGSASFDTSRGSPSMSSRSSARERLPPGKMHVLEEKLQQVLTRVAFEDEVIRMATGIYRFGKENAQLRLSMDGEVFASQDDSFWQPVADFVDALRARRAWQNAHGTELPAPVTNGIASEGPPLRAYVVAPGQSPGSVSPADDAAGHAVRIPPEFESLFLGGQNSAKDGGVPNQPSWHKSCGSDKVVVTSARGPPRRSRDGILSSSRRQDQGCTSSPSSGSYPPTAPAGTKGPWGGGSGSFTSLGGGGGSLEEGGGSLTSICSGGGCASSNSSLHQGGTQVAAGGSSARRSNPGSVHGPAASPVSTPLSPFPPASPSRTPATMRPEPQQTMSPLRAAVHVVANGSCCVAPHPANAAAGLASAGFVQSPSRRRPSSAQSRSASHSNSPVRAAVASSITGGASSQPGSMIIPVASAAMGAAGSGSSTPSPLRSQLPTRAGSLSLPVKHAGGVVARPVARPRTSSDGDTSLRARPFREVSPLPASVPGQTCQNIYRGPSPVRPPVSNPGQLLSAHAATGGVVNVLDPQGAPTPVTRVAVRASSASPTPRARSMYVQSPHHSGGGRVVAGAISPQHVWRT